MQLVDHVIEPSPARPDALRVSVALRMEKAEATHRIWYDLPAERRDGLSHSGNPWLVLMLPIAVSAGEDISIPLPVDPHLLENVEAVVRVWHGWFPHLRPAEVQAPTMSAPPPPSRRRGMFFSGGVDSFFTLLRHDDELTGCGSGPVDTLLFMEGFDIPVTASDEVLSARRQVQKIAGEFGKVLLPVGTNVKDVYLPLRQGWRLSHGCALAAIAHLFENDFAEFIVSSTHEFGQLLPIGSHPMTDPLLSSRHLKIVHDGARFSRNEKVERVARSERARRNLRICWESRQNSNCGRCRKCLITMLQLDLYGWRGKAEAFDWSSYSVENVRRLSIDTESQALFFEHIAEAAGRLGRPDIEGVVRECLRSSRRVRDIVQLTQRVPFLWRFDYQIREMLRRRPSPSHAVGQAGDGHARS